MQDRQKAKSLHTSQPATQSLFDDEPAGDQDEHPQATNDDDDLGMFDNDAC